MRIPSISRRPARTRATTAETFDANGREEGEINQIEVGETGNVITRAEGRWVAADIDEGAELRIFVGAVDLGQIGLGNDLIYEGRYGDLTFRAGGQWEYQEGRAEQIAEGEREETFTVTIVDQQWAVSNTINLVITVTGTNDAPVASPQWM